MSVGHIGIYVEPARLDEMINWYLTVLKPIGYKMHHDLRPQHQVVGIGSTYPDFWIASDPKYIPKEKLHIAFCSKNRQAIRDFHAAALKAGGTDNGPPGPRPHYARSYYGAYVFDPEGRNIEVMSILPGIITETKSRNALIATTVLLLGVTLGYFTNLIAYFS